MNAKSPLNTEKKAVSYDVTRDMFTKKIPKKKNF